MHRSLPATGLRAGRAAARDTVLDESYRLCRAITKANSKTFYFASLFLPPPKRRAIWALYAFCRTSDDVVDSDRPAPEQLAALEGWEEELRLAFDGRPRHPMLRALAQSVREFAVPLRPALELLEGARRDITVRRYESYDELAEYCYLVASTVGLLCSPVLGCKPEAVRYGAMLGHAMQMTNILRDVGEDYRMGRIYLPAEDLRRFGYSEQRLAAGTVDAAFVALMRFEIARIRALYDEAAPGIELLDAGSRYTVRLALALYRGILDEIERNGYDVFSRRAFVPLRKKLAWAATIALRGRP